MTISPAKSLFVVLIAESLAFGANFNGERMIFGVSFRWETPSKNVHQWFEQNLDNRAKTYAKALDPDCRYAEKSKPCSNPFPKITEKIESFSKKMAKETNELFDVNDGADGKRDFDGLSQGYFLEQLRQEIPGKWAADFAGDIFVSAGMKLDADLTIADPWNEKYVYADVIMESGWMTAATGSALDGKVRNSGPDELSRVILFADSTFDGGRIDAWDTAIVAGGRTLIASLWNLKTFRGKWGYLYFDGAKNAFCSPNIQCHLKQNKKRDGLRSVTVSFRN